MRFETKYLIPIGSILFGGIFAVLSLLNYEIYSPTKGPMAGFMPVLVGGFLAVSYTHLTLPTNSRV